MFGKKRPGALHPAINDGPPEATEAFRSDTEPGGDVMLLQPFMQVRLAANEIAVTAPGVIVPQGNFVWVLFDDPVALQIADVEDGDIGKVGDKLPEGRKVIFENGAVLDRRDGEEARLAEQ